MGIFQIIVSYVIKLAIPVLSILTSFPFHLNPLPLTLLFLLLQRISQPPGQNQQNGKRSHCQLLSLPFNINLNNTSFNISIAPEDFIFLTKNLLNYVLKAAIYLTMAGENFKIYGVQITRKCICKSKNWKYTLLMSPGKTLPDVLIITSRQKEITNFSPSSIFFLKI